MAYNAFISYSHAADGKLAPALQSALHRFAKPWYRLRQLHVFRDKTSLTAGSGPVVGDRERAETIRMAGALSVAGSRACHWVQKEIGWWIENRATNRLLALLTEGDIVWEPGRNDLTGPERLPYRGSWRDGFPKSRCMSIYAGQRPRRSYRPSNLGFSTPWRISRRRSIAGARKT